MKDKKYQRPDWDEYFLLQAIIASSRSTCLRHNVGAVITKNNKNLTTGYNGAATKCKDCLKLGCLRDALKIKSGEKHEICRGIHAEQNAIIQAAKDGIKIDGGTLYCTHSPCIICAKMIINSGIKKIISFSNYPNTGNVKELLTEAKIEIVHFKKTQRMKEIIQVLGIKK